MVNSSPIIQFVLTMKVFVVLFFVAFFGSRNVQSDDISISKFRFTGMKNVWHDGVQHQSLDVGNETADGRTKLLQICANRCALSGQECEAFYYETQDDGTECHLVDEDLESGKNRIIGHGQDLTDRIYYVKEAIDEAVVVTRPLGLEPPCDTDDTELSEEQCDEYPSEVLTAYECSNLQTTYLSTIQQVSDIKCPGEDRILQCELQNGKAGSNIDVKNRATLLQDAFLKSFEDPIPFRSVVGDLIEYLEMDFGRAREVTRIIIRSASDDKVDKLKAGTFKFFKGQETADLPFEFTTENTCAIHIILSRSTDPLHAISLETDKVRMDIDPGFHSVTKSRTGFKIDVFLKELTLVPPPSNTNSTSSQD